jgi:pilus assembly protein FimV
VRKSLLKLLGVVAVLTLSTTVSAAGMGGINVASALGQPLKADIELVAISKTEKDSLVARLASPEAYKSAGLDYPYGNKFKFQIDSRADGQPYIKASSAQPVNDPFVSLLVELTWSSGKLSREYTFLLDPPGYVPEQPAPAVVQAVAPEVQAAAPELAASAVPEVTAATPAEQTVPVVAVPPAEQAAPSVVEVPPAEQAASSVAAATPAEQAAPAETAVKPEEKAAPEAAAAQENNMEFFAVKRGDTMHKIAEKYKPADVSLERMLVAIYRANADHFDGRNMNRIKAGKVLHFPSQQELMSVSQPDAVKEIHAQAADWNAYRQKLASAATVGNQTQAAQQVATGKISSSIADMAPVVKESAREVLKLSKGEAPGDQVGTGAGGKSMSVQDQKNAAQEEAIAKNKALKEGQERTALLEKNIQDMQHLAQLKAEAAALAQPPVTVKAAVSEVMATSAVKPAPVAQPKPVPKPMPKEVKPEPSLLDQVLDEPLYLAGAALALLVLGGLSVMLYRRKKNSSDGDTGQPIEDVGEISGRMAAPVLPSPETGDFTNTAAAQPAAVSQSDNVDPISEADLFLNFGRDVQAEEILKEALQNTPNNHQIHLKLLGIYVTRKDTNSFSTIARQLKDAGDEDAWKQAAAMGRKLEPNNPMYGGAIENAGSATVQMTAFDATPEPENVPKPQASALDFDFDINASAAKQATSPEQDFLGGAEQTSVMSADGRLAAQGAEMDFDVTSTKTSKAGGMDFDVTSTHPSMGAAGMTTEAVAQVSDDMVFDVTGSQSFKPAAVQPELNKPAKDDGGMEFTLDFPVEKAAGKSATAQSDAIGLAGISLNFDDAPASSGSTAENKDDHWQDVATKLDLAKAYHEMGDASGAREILEEVLREGDAGQREAAQNLFEQLG